SPRYRINRPSLAISDPAAICPLNLQRDSIAFERMETEQRLARDILREHVLNVSKVAQSIAGVGGLVRLCKELYSFRDVDYPGQIEPLCCTKAGYTLASPVFFSELGIRTIIFVDGATKDTALGFSHIGDTEAVLLRNSQTGAASYFEWFRGFWSKVLEIAYY